MPVFNMHDDYYQWASSTARHTIISGINQLRVEHQLPYSVSIGRGMPPTTFPLLPVGAQPTDTNMKIACVNFIQSALVEGDYKQARPHIKSQHKLHMQLSVIESLLGSGGRNGKPQRFVMLQLAKVLLGEQNEHFVKEFKQHLYAFYENPVLFIRQGGLTELQGSFFRLQFIAKKVQTYYTTQNESYESYQRAAFQLETFIEEVELMATQIRRVPHVNRAEISAAHFEDFAKVQSVCSYLANALQRTSTDLDVPMKMNSIMKDRKFRSRENKKLSTRTEYIAAVMRCIWQAIADVELYVKHLQNMEIIDQAINIFPHENLNVQVGEMFVFLKVQDRDFYNSISMSEVFFPTKLKGFKLRKNMEWREEEKKEEEAPPKKEKEQKKRTIGNLMTIKRRRYMRGMKAVFAHHRANYYNDVIEQIAPSDCAMRKVIHKKYKYLKPRPIFQVVRVDRIPLHERRRRDIQWWKTMGFANELEFLMMAQEEQDALKRAYDEQAVDINDQMYDQMRRGDIHYDPSESDAEPDY